MDTKFVPLISRAITGVAALALAGAVFAGAMPCDRVEYTQLKDSNKRELADIYCSAQRRADLNKDLRALKQELFSKKLELGLNTDETFKELKEFGEAQVTCVRVAESAGSMLSKKFKSKAPSSCE